MTDRDALRDALEAFYRAAQGSCDYPLCPSQHEGYAFDCVEAAKQRVEEVAAALAGSGPEAGLRAAVQRYIESPTSANWQSVERLLATTTASPTACDRLCIHVEGCDRAASPTATGERE